jgi:hypothetical protein
VLLYLCSLQPIRRLIFVLSVFLALPVLDAHEHEPITHSFDNGQASDGACLHLRIVDDSTNAPIAARVSLLVDGEVYVPQWVNDDGIRFTSIHKSKGQTFTAVYARGTGTLAVDLPVGAKRVTATATRGFEYVPANTIAKVTSDETTLDLRLKRWTNLDESGWIAVDEHLHFDRLDPADDERWLAMMEADGLSAAHFMVLKGGMTPGLWSRQFDYGEAGRTDDGERSITPGQEYRDNAQGHINLLGIGKVIEPYSTGGMGWPAIVENYPPLHDVLAKARSQGALVGAAHGGTLGKHSTALADAVLGAMDFLEISNGFIYKVENWYRLMNCGFSLPPVAGTDLPNSPLRDPWQPMLGSIRTYVNTDGQHDFDSFGKALAKGRVFISGGPIISLTVDGKEIGDTLDLPKSRIVIARAELSSPRALQEFKLVHNGENLETSIHKSQKDDIHRWTIERKIQFNTSGWIAAWGKGQAIKMQGFDAMAHTNAIRVIVDKQPIRSEGDRVFVLNQLEERRTYYQNQGAYKNDAQRKHAVELFDEAIAVMKAR